MAKKIFIIIGILIGLMFALLFFSYVAKDVGIETFKLIFNSSLFITLIILFIFYLFYCR